MRHGYWLAGLGSTHGDPEYAALARAHGLALFTPDAKWDRYDGCSVYDGKVVMIARNWFNERVEFCREERAL